MASLPFTIGSVLPVSTKPGDGLRALLQAGGHSQTVLIDGLSATLFWPDEETIWIRLQTPGQNALDRWYGPGDLRNAAVEALVNRILR